MSDARQREEVAWLRAQLEQRTAELERVRRHIAAQEELTALFAAPAADGTGPVPRVSARPVSHRTPKDQRWLRVVPGFILPAGLRMAWKAKPMMVAGVGAAAITAITMSPARTLEYKTPFDWHSPSAVIDGAKPLILPSSRTAPLAYVTPRPTPKPLAREVRRVQPVPVVVAPVPVVVPVVAPAVASSQSQGSSWSGQDSSSQSSQSSSAPGSSQPSDWSQQSQTSQSPGWQAQGRRAAGDTPPGDSTYQPRHGNNGGVGDYWQTDMQQGASWLSGAQQGGYGQRGGR